MQTTGKLKITVLAENTARKRGLLAEHGLSFLIETGQHRLLFDTGQGLALRHNTDHLKIDLQHIDAVALSHGHYDHSGGLTFALNAMSNPLLYVHPEAFNLKYARNDDGTARDVGMSAENKRSAHELAEVVPVEGKTEIAPDLFLTGPIPRITDFEDTGGAFFKNAACTIPDDLPDDQALFAETLHGIVVILGCAHAGVINTLWHIQTLTENRPIHTVIGGMHLLHADSNRMEKTINELRRLNIQHLHPCHCTGFAATAQLWNDFSKKCAPCPVGSVIEIKTSP